jgi:hypothetical protein
MLFAFGLTVTIGPSGFPPQVSIQDGDSVTRKNDDTVNRQVVADDGTWKSPVLAPGQSDHEHRHDQGPDLAARRDGRARDDPAAAARDVDVDRRCRGRHQEPVLRGHRRAARL